MLFGDRFDRSQGKRTETVGVRDNIVVIKLTFANANLDCEKQSILCIGRLNTLTAKAVGSSVFIIARHQVAGQGLCYVVLNEKVNGGCGCSSIHYDRTNNGTSYKTDNILCHKSVSLLRLLAEEDISLEEAASVLNISVDMANKYISIVKSIYGVDTLPAAVLQAAGEHLISPVLQRLGVALMS